MKLKYKNYFNSHPFNSNIKLQIPDLCPCCGVSHNPTTEYISTVPVNENRLYIFSHNCSSCNKKSITFNQRTEADDSNCDMLLNYPNYQSIHFDELINQLSPRFVSLYNQAHFCEENNFTDLAGMGYRAAIEVLIKDYALDFDLEPYDKIAKRNLNRAIDTYFKSDKAAMTSADVVRIFGNDFAHWDKNETYELKVLKQYLNIFIQIILTKLLLKHPPVTR